MYLKQLQEVNSIHITIYKSFRLNILRNSFLKSHFILIALFISISVLPQDNLKKHKLNYGALAQFHFSYANSDSIENPYGFRIRRIDFKVWQTPTEKFDWSLLLGFGDFYFQILEVDVNFKLNNSLALRIGQFAPPAVRSAAPVDDLFKVPIMTFIERPPITLNWSSFSNLHAYRTLGIQLHGKVLKEKFYYAFMVGNPKGSNFFKASSKNVYHTNQKNGLSLWGRMEYEIGTNFVAGTFYNTGNSTSDTIRFKRNSYGTHILYRKNNISFMTEFIQGENYTDNLKTAYYRGYFIEGGYSIKSIEPAFRFDFYEPLINNYDDFFVRRYNNYTIGLNIFPAKKLKIQINYIFKTEVMKSDCNSIKNDLFYMNLQCLL
jgi:hypothetical protein